MTQARYRESQATHKWLVLLGLALAPSPALAQTTASPDFGLDWVTVGAPGNRPTTPEEVPLFNGRPRGAVDYEYRIMRTEINVTQWFEFVEAFAPFTDQALNDLSFTSGEIRFVNGVGHQIIAGTENRPIRVNWRNAARFANWLHNDKALTAEAFETGAYDASTFGRDADGTITDQVTHLPGARFWIPTLDEWTKAVYYDQNKNGPGQEGYWQHPYQSDSPAISGFPESGGQTNGGIEGHIPDRLLNLRAYPNAQTPWGLFDVSGGSKEFVLKPEHNQFSADIGFKGSFAGLPSPLYEEWDWLSFFGGAGTISSRQGLRLASSIPAPPSVFLVLLSFTLTCPRRQR